MTEWNLYHDNENRNYNDIKRIEQLENYIRKLSDPNHEIYVSRIQEYEVKEQDGSIRLEKVFHIKNIQQMTKDAQMTMKGKEDD